MTESNQQMLEQAQPPQVIQGGQVLPVAEEGVTTSEWKVLTVTAAFVVGDGAAKLGLMLTPDQQNVLTQLLAAAVALAITWIGGRSFRKRGTTA